MTRTPRRPQALAAALAVVFFCLVSAPLSAADPATARATDQAVLQAVDQAQPQCRAVADKVFAFRETGGQEVQSAAVIKQALAKLGFTVTGDLAVPADLVPGGVAKTAFKAVMQGSGPGPTVVVMLEYDALSNGHSCGHNLITGAGLMTAAALAAFMPHTPGRLVVIGTPDEERGSAGGGKIALLEGGHFDGADVVLAFHPADRFSLDQRFLAMKRALFTFKGKAAHAAAAPYQGVNALDAVILTFNGVGLLRQQLREDVRVHGIVTKGGDKVNVIPELAQAEFAVRALDTKGMENAYAKVVACARAAETATGATLDYSPPRVSVSAPLAVPPLLDLVAAKLPQAGVDAADVKNFTDFASSDLGNVAYHYPTVNLWFKVAPEGTALHTDALREAAGSEAGWQGAVLAAKAMTLAARDLYADPAKMEAVKQAFAQAKAQ